MLRAESAKEKGGGASFEDCRVPVKQGLVWRLVISMSSSRRASRLLPHLFASALLHALAQSLPLSCASPQKAKVVVRDPDSDLTGRLHLFGVKDLMGWPFVAVPLVRGLGTVRGVLGVDSFEACGRGRPDEEAPEPGVVDFLARVRLA